MKAKHVTIRDIAKETGVSIASVSRALNGLGGIGEDTRDRVLQACEKLGYVPNTLARGLVLKRTQTIGVIMPDISSPYYSNLMIQTASIAKEYGYQVLLCNSFRNYEIETNCFNLLIGNQVEGIIFFPVGHKSSQRLKQFVRYIPIISLSRMPEDSVIPSICADEYESGKIAVEHLIHCGCQKLLYVGYTSESIAYQERVRSFSNTVKKAGIEGEVFESNIAVKGAFEQGYRRFFDFLNQNRYRPDGVIASSDEAANGVLKACMEWNIKVPEEMSLIGFDNINASLPTLKLTSVAISHKRQVQEAIELLLAMKDNHVAFSEPINHLLKPRLFERDSCCKKQM